MKAKPEKRTFDPVYAWRDVSDWILHKHGKDLRNFAGTRFTGEPDDPPYQDLWHWVLETVGGEIRNGCFFYLPLWYIDEPDTEAWVKEALSLVRDEFLDDDSCDLELWVDW